MLLLPARAPQPEHGSQAEIAALGAQLLAKHAPMLSEYFALDIDDCGRLAALPALIDHWAPDTSRLPQLALDLTTEVDWEDETGCFHTISRVLAAFYAVAPSDGDEGVESGGPAAGNASQDAAPLGSGQPGAAQEAAQRSQPAGVPSQPSSSAANVKVASKPASSSPMCLAPSGSALEPDNEAGPSPAPAGEPLAPVAGANAASAAAAGGTLSSVEAAASKDGGGLGPGSSRDWQMRHVLFPAVKVFLAPPRQRATDGSVVQLTSLEKLYRTFERC